jgi:hypothetical protein
VRPLARAAAGDTSPNRSRAWRADWLRGDASGDYPRRSLVLQSRERFQASLFANGHFASPTR